MMDVLNPEFIKAMIEAIIKSITLQEGRDEGIIGIDNVFGWGNGFAMWNSHFFDGEI